MGNFQMEKLCMWKASNNNGANAESALLSADPIQKVITEFQPVMSRADKG